MHRRNCCNAENVKKKLNALSNILQAIAEPNRLKILCLLSSGTKCVCHIQKALSLKQNLVSHHLGILRKHGLINYRKTGQWKHYSLEKKTIRKYKSMFDKILAF